MENNEPKNKLIWFLDKFTTREHFLRFLGTSVLALTAWLLFSHATIPEGWWGILGVVMGYFFRGSPDNKE